MIQYQGVQIKGINFDIRDVEELLQNLRVLYTTAIGTVPFDREFGLNMDFLDMPMDIAKGRLTQQYIEKTREYEPRVIVQEVKFETDTGEGIVIPKVVINVDA